VTVQVETSLGRIEGRRENGAVAFRGIPFAAPPLGAARWRAPAPAKPWAGVRPALEFGGSAPQNETQLGALPGMAVGRQDEDCLTLNVYVPESPAEGGARPVLVWLHGGGFVIGSGSQTIYDGGPLARRGDAVVVTVNYRLGALGFLDLEGRFGEAFAGSANAGLRDQIAALAWVRENAAAFGGDPGNVTIFGESAGGMSVATLLGTPAAQGLFHKAIPQSGAAHNVHDREAAQRIVHHFLEALGTRDAAALREVPVDELLRAQLRALAAWARPDAPLAFQPVVEGDLLPEPPLDALRGGLAADVPVLTGTTREEWRLFQFMDRGMASLDDAGFARRVGERVPEAHAGRLAEAYRKDRADATAPDRFVDFETDRVFRIPAVRLAEARAAARAPVFAYEFTWRSPGLGGALGACHAIELGFVFGTLDAPGMDRFCGSGPEAEALRDRMMDAWATFARTGEPGHAALPRWPAYESGERAVLVLDREPRLARAPRDAVRRAWDGVL